MPRRDKMKDLRKLRDEVRELEYHAYWAGRYYHYIGDTKRHKEMGTARGRYEREVGRINDLIDNESSSSRANAKENNNQ